MLNVGVIGLGTVSLVHIRGIKESFFANLTAVCDIDKNKEDEEPGVPFYIDVTEMLKQENLDVVHICLPHHLHDSVALECARAGVHVFLEKPVAVDYPASQKLADEHEKLNNGTKIGICFQNRLNETVIELKRRLKNDQSPIIAVKGMVAWYRPETYYTDKTWRGTWLEAGSGTIINQSIHTLDLMRHVIDQEWTECKGQVSKLLDYSIEVEDTANANFLFDKGTRGLFFATNAYFGNDSVELQVVTEKTRYTIKDNRLFDDEGNSLMVDASLPDSKIYYGPSHKKAMEQFYKAIGEDTNHYCDIQDALPTMQMVDVMKESSKRNETIKKEEFLNGQNWRTSNDVKGKIRGVRSV